MRRAVTVKEEDIHVFLNHHEPIISEEDFRKVQDKFEIRSGKYRKSAASKDDPDLLKGLTKCAYCGRALIYLRKNEATRVKTSKYYCENHTGINPVGEMLSCRPEIAAEDMKSEVVRLCNEYFNRIAALKKASQFRKNKLIELKEEIIERERQVNQYSRELVALYEQYVYENITKDEFISGKDEIDEKKKTAKEYVEKCRKRLNDLEVRCVPATGEKMDEEAIRRVVSEVILDGNKGIKVRFKEDPVIDEAFFS